MIGQGEQVWAPTDIETGRVEASNMLEVQDLEKHFGGVRAVDGLSFSVLEGSITGLIGPNGAGKSTVIETVTGFERPDGGVIKFRGAEIQGELPHRIARRGLMRTFQIAREWPALTVMENMLAVSNAGDRARLSAWRGVLTPGGLRRRAETDAGRCADVLERFGLLHMRDDLASTLSGGQKRLLEFARLLVARPRMILLDEPLAGVNPVMARQVIDAVRTLAGDGITILLVEHNLGAVETLCSEVVVMASGHRISSGSMEVVRNDPAVVDAYLGAVVSAPGDSRDE